MFDINDLSSIKVGLASPDTIRGWSKGEVTKPETINYRSQKPEPGGLFCEKIFGPSKDYECHCGKYKKIRYQGITCEKCGVEVISKEWRRERFGHIDLVSPCSHIWYLKGIPSRMAMVLDIPPKQLEEIIYFAAHIVLNPGDSTVLKYKQYINDKEGREAFVKAIEEFKDAIPEGSSDRAKADEILAKLGNESETFDFFTASAFINDYTGAEFGEGAEAIKALLHDVDLEAERKKILEEIRELDSKNTRSVMSQDQDRSKLSKRLEIIQSFIDSDQKPEWMILDAIPVIPPDLRPMLPLDGGRFAASDLNDLYRHVISRNNRLRRFIEVSAPHQVLMNEKRMVQEAVDALIDNGRRSKAVTGPSGNRPLKSLSSGLKGKQGRFRQNLLGKRVDYSGRSVIAVGPDLKMYQCGLPREMAIQLLRPFIASILIKRGFVNAHRQADKYIDKYDSVVFDIIEEIIDKHPVLLNRAPTLHRLGIQAFQPKLVDGHAIRLHPLVCTGFNADFDGDQMAVHVPLSKAAQKEALELMLASNNILGPKDGKPIVIPSQDMILGNYYLTIEETRANLLERADALRKIEILDPLEKEANEKQADLYTKYASLEGKVFASVSEVLDAYETGNIHIHTRIAIPAKAIHKTFGDDLTKAALPESVKNKYLITTVGKIIFNEIFPDDFVYINDVPEKWASSQKGIESWFVSAKEVMDYLGSDYKEDSDLSPLAQYLIKKDKVEPVKKPISKKPLGVIIDMIFRKYDMRYADDDTSFHASKTSAILDKIKDQGFKYSTVCAVTVAIDEIKVIDGKYDQVISVKPKKGETLEALVARLNEEEREARKNHAIKGKTPHLQRRLQEIEKDVFYRLDGKDVVKVGEVTRGQLKVDNINRLYEEGFLTDKERYKNVCSVWEEVTNYIKSLVEDLLAKDKRNPLVIMADSGARGSADNFKQLIGMKGLVANPKNETIEMPIISSYREGMKVAEFFINSHGARKGGADTALKTADSGYLTRRLVDVAQDVIVREDDCHCDHGFEVMEIRDTSQNSIITPLKERLAGRFAMRDIIDPNTNKVIVSANTMISDEQANQIVKAGIEKVEIRSIFTCRTKNGVCQHCYGRNMATGRLVNIGESVGIMAAQSIGEPGTQLTMRVFHTGGMAGSDITQGLPRVQELVEARNPNGEAIIAKFKGKVTDIKKQPNGTQEVVVESLIPSTKESPVPESFTYPIPLNSKLRVEKGDVVIAGGKITEGAKNPKTLLAVSDPTELEVYMIKEIRKVYATQGIGISDKHLEIIVRQMLRKVLIISSGDTNLIPSTKVDIDTFTAANKPVLLAGGRPAVAKPCVMGIAKAALASESFLSAASFQETTKVLTDAAIKGKSDPLHGLKENVITGKLIPAGSGLLSEREEKEVLSTFSVEGTMKEVRSQYIEAHDRQED
ncbi:MAG: DNA-directed RNA polymerase subunit beta' [Bacilli bacterium]|nr:DNA-directed RNA polymerase subunit beta' [Bacilli bacterium]